MQISTHNLSSEITTTTSYESEAIEQEKILEAQVAELRKIIAETEEAMADCKLAAQKNLPSGSFPIDTESLEDLIEISNIKIQNTRSFIRSVEWDIFTSRLGRGYYNSLIASAGLFALCLGGSLYGLYSFTHLNS